MMAGYQLQPAKTGAMATLVVVVEVGGDSGGAWSTVVTVMMAMTEVDLVTVSTYINTADATHLVPLLRRQC